MGLVLISCNYESKIFQNLNIIIAIIANNCVPVSEEFDCIISTYFSTSSSVIGKMQSHLVTFLRFCSSIIDLKYSLKFMAKKLSCPHQSRFLDNHESLEYTTLCS